MVNQIGMGRPINPLQPLLNGCKLPKGRRDHLNQKPWQKIPEYHDARANPPHQLGQLPREHNDVEERLREVRVDHRHGGRPFLDVRGEALVGVADAAVKVAQLVENHVFKVRFVEVFGQAAFEVYCQAFVDEVQEGVYEGGRHCY